MLKKRKGILHWLLTKIEKNVILFKEGDVNGSE